MNESCKEIYQKGVSALQAAGVENAGGDALHLLLSAFGFDRTAWLLKRDGPADAKAALRYEEMIRKRAARVPLQYILQTQPFLDHDYSVGEGVLIPRPETETLAQLGISFLRSAPNKTVYDLCAGSGCIGLSIAGNCPDAEVYLFEKYGPALYYLYKNAGALGGRAHVTPLDIMNGVPQTLPPPALLVSNPPYIASGELGALSPEVQKEPSTALDGGADGLDFYRVIARDWFPRLLPGGACLLECGEGQAREIAETLFCGYRTAIIKDVFGVDRFLRVDR